jgi:CBS domain containing-hemolysin-like protein
VTDLVFPAIVGLVPLLVLELLLEASRAAFENTNLARMLGHQEHPLPQLNQTRALLGNLPKLRASLQLAQMFARFLIAGLVLLIIYSRFGNTKLVWAGVVGIIAAGTILFLLEWIVSTRVMANPETWAFRLTGFARIVRLVLAPVVFLAVRSPAGKPHTQNGTVTETELMNLVEAGQQGGILEQEEQKMIVSIFRLGDTLAREIMVPRIDILALDVSTPPEAAIDSFLASGHSRVPVYRETVDNILGVLYAKDMLRTWREGNRLSSLEPLLREAYFIPEAKKVDELLAELQARRVHMAIVVDEYGGVAGLVTLEDIVEEIVGEIQDEYDQAEESLYQEINPDEYLFHGRIDLDDFNELMGTDLPKVEADTLGGLIYSRIGRVPISGDTIQIDDLNLTVEQVIGRRIRKVRAQKTVHSTENGDKN